MSWKPCHPGISQAHTWESVYAWNGRYRCSVCAVIGYRGVVGKRLRGAEIIPYRCPECHGPTTDFGINPSARSLRTQAARRCPACAPTGTTCPA